MAARTISGSEISDGTPTVAPVSTKTMTHDHDQARASGVPIVPPECGATTWYAARLTARRSSVLINLPLRVILSGGRQEST